MTTYHFPRLTADQARDHAEAMVRRARTLRHEADQHDVAAAECRRLAGEALREGRNWLNASEGIFTGLAPRAVPLPGRSALLGRLTRAIPFPHRMRGSAP